MQRAAHAPLCTLLAKSMHTRLSGWSQAEPYLRKPKSERNTARTARPVSPHLLISSTTHTHILLPLLLSTVLTPLPPSSWRPRPPTCLPHDAPLRSQHPYTVCIRHSRMPGHHRGHTSHRARAPKRQTDPLRSLLVPAPSQAPTPITASTKRPQSEAQRLLGRTLHHTSLPCVRAPAPPSPQRLPLPLPLGARAHTHLHTLQLDTDRALALPPIGQHTTPTHSTRTSREPAAATATARSWVAAHQRRARARGRGTCAWRLRWRTRSEVQVDLQMCIRIRTRRQRRRRRRPSCLCLGIALWGR